MSCCGASPDYKEIDEVSRLVSGKLAAFLKTLRDNAFAVGLQEGRDAAALMAAGYAEKPGLLRVAFKHLFSARKSGLGPVRRPVRRVLARPPGQITIDHRGVGKAGQ